MVSSAHGARRSTKHTSAASSSASSSSHKSSASQKSTRAKSTPPKSTRAPKSTAPPPPSAHAPHSLRSRVAHARAQLAKPIIAQYTGIALMHPDAPDRLWICEDASLTVRGALDRMQQEDHLVHDAKSNKRTVPREMRVRYALIAVAPQLSGVRLTPLTKLINHAWGTNDNAPNNKLFFGSAHTALFSLHDGASKQSGGGQAMTDADGLRFHEEYIRAKAAAHRENGTPAEWAKDGSASMHACIHTLRRYLAADPTLTVDTIAITIRADGTPSLPGYPGGQSSVSSSSPVSAAQSAVQSAPALVAKKNCKRAASVPPPSSARAAQSASALSRPCRFQCRRVRHARDDAATDSADTVVEASDSSDDEEDGSDDEHTDAASAIGTSGSVAATSPRSNARTHTECDPIVEEGEEDEWNDHSHHSEKAPTEAASSLVEAPVPSHSGLVLFVDPDSEDQMDDDPAQREQQHWAAMIHETTMAINQLPDGAAAFEPRWSPLSFRSPVFFESPSPHSAAESSLAHTRVVDGLSDDEVRSCMGDDEERSHPLEFACAQLLETPQARPDEDAHEQRQWSAYQSGLMERAQTAHDDYLQYMSDA